MTTMECNRVVRAGGRLPGVRLNAGCDQPHRQQAEHFACRLQRRIPARSRARSFAQGRERSLQAIIDLIIGQGFIVGHLVPIL